MIEMKKGIISRIVDARVEAQSLGNEDLKDALADAYIRSENEIIK